MSTDKGKLSIDRQAGPVGSTKCYRVYVDDTFIGKVAQWPNGEWTAEPNPTRYKTRAEARNQIEKRHLLNNSTVVELN